MDVEAAHFTARNSRPALDYLLYFCRGLYNLFGRILQSRATLHSGGPAGSDPCMLFASVETGR